MPIANFGQWSATAGSNSDIGSVTLSNNMTPTQIDDAIRNMMGQLKTALPFGTSDNRVLRTDGLLGAALQPSTVILTDVGSFNFPSGGGLAVQVPGTDIGIVGRMVFNGSISNAVKVRVQGVPAGHTAYVAQGSTGSYGIAFLNASETTVGSIRIDASAIVIATSSDGRLKPKREDFDSGAIIDALEPVRHNWLHDENDWAYGLIAQAVYEVVPQAVNVGSDAGPGEDGFEAWGVDYSKLVPILLRELKDVRERLSKLERGGW